MTSWLAVARTVHYASAMLVFGELVFALFVMAPEPLHARVLSHRRFNRFVGWSIVASLASWIVWLGCEAVEMSGASIEQALRPELLATVLRQTAFGRLWLLRVILALVLSAILWRTARPAQLEHAPAPMSTAFVIAGAYLASLAWAGHAAAAADPERDVQLACDALHLLAAGGWVGALPALVALLRREPALVTAPAARFSTLGVVTVTLLLFTGFVNAWYLVGDIPALVGTLYGRLLLAKLALFAAMLALAAVNRWRLTPHLSTGGASARSRLRHNAVLEIAAGAGIVAIVAALGITIPAAHQSPVWPFSFGLDLEPAHPTSYATPPLRYTTSVIARGAAVYARECQGCHGPLGRGDGPAGAALPIKPADLAEHAAFHRPGDLFWLVAHGVPDTPMPAFGDKLNETDLWSTVRFLRALSDSEAMNETAAMGSSPRPIVAPDFPYEIAGRGQESLARPREREMTLLVFYTLPQSLARMQALGERSNAERAIRVIAVPQQGSSSGAQDPTHVITGADVPSVYAMFARTPDSKAPAAHAEFLIDDRGFLRRRWLGVPEDPMQRTAEILRAADAVAREPPLRAMEKWHAH